jgi:hypothetical protein
VVDVVEGVLKELAQGALLSQERDIVQELSTSSGECGLVELDGGFEMAMAPPFMLQIRGNVSLSTSSSGLIRFTPSDRPLPHHACPSLDMVVPHLAPANNIEAISGSLSLCR